MLLGNGVRLTMTSPLRHRGGAGASTALRAQASSSGAMRGWYAGEATSGDDTAQCSARPSGYYPPASWMLAPKAGAIASRNIIDGTGSISAANLAGGLNAEASLTGSGSVSAAALTALGVLSSALTGLGEIASAALAGSVNLSASLSGSGSASGTLAGSVNLEAALAGVGSLAASIAGAIAASAALSGSGSLSGDIGGALNATAALSGSGTLAGAIVGSWSMASALAGSGTLAGSISAPGNIGAALTGAAILAAAIRADAHLSAALTVAGGSDPLSPSSLAAAVWSAAAASYVASGTTGAALTIVRKILQNRTVTDPSTGRITVYDDDDTVLLEADLFEDAAGTTPYDGDGAERRDRLE